MTHSHPSLDEATTPIKVMRAHSANPVAPSQSSNQSSAKAGKPTGSNQNSFENQKLTRQLELAVSNSAAINELFGNIARVVCSQSECLALWVTQAEADGNFSKVHSLFNNDDAVVWDLVSDLGQQIIGHVRETRQVASAPLPFQSTSQLLAVPVSSTAAEVEPADQGGLASRVELVVLGCFSNQNQSSLRLQWLMGMAGQAVTSWYQQQSIQQVQNKNRSLLDTMAMIKELDLTKSTNQSAMVLVNHMRRLCQVEQVGLNLGGKLVAVSDVEQIDRNNESNRLVEQASGVAVRTGKTVLFIDGDEESGVEKLALETYCRASRIESCVSIPLCRNDGDVFGAVLLAGRASRFRDQSFAEYTMQLAEMVAGHLDTILRANRSVLQNAVLSVRQAVNNKWRTHLLIGMACVGALMATPLPYRVGCDCEVQPTLRRFVAAPYDGILERTLVENGELVEEDQLLAQMDGRSIRMELSALQADLAGATKRRDAAMVQREFGKKQIAKSEMERYQAKIDLLHQKSLNLEVRSPITGMVISGDLEKVEGAPLEMGQSLYEIAPLNEMVSEISIPESEIHYVKPGMDVDVKLSAFPFKTWTGKIRRINPSAEIIADESVFVAEVELAYDGIDLRPGMKGTAKIKTVWSPIGWNLFHRSWEAVRYWTIW